MVGIGSRSAVQVAGSRPRLPVCGARPVPSVAEGLGLTGTDRGACARTERRQATGVADPLEMGLGKPRRFRTSQQCLYETRAHRALQARALRSRGKGRGADLATVDADLDLPLDAHA